MTSCGIACASTAWLNAGLNSDRARAKTGCDVAAQLRLAFLPDSTYLRLHPDIVATRWGWRREGPAPKAFAEHVSKWSPGGRYRPPDCSDRARGGSARFRARARQAFGRGGRAHAAGHGRGSGDRAAR